jgi:hypothetical protein
VTRLVYLVLFALGVLLGLSTVSRALDRAFPARPAQAWSLERAEPCGWHGKRRIWCGVEDGFVGPLRDHRKVRR